MEQRHCIGLRKGTIDDGIRANSHKRGTREEARGVLRPASIPGPIAAGRYYDYPRIQEFGNYWRESCEMCGHARVFWLMRRPSGP